MGRPSKNKADYVAAGLRKDLIYDGPPITPRSIKNTTRWICTHCKQPVYKSYRAVAGDSPGCVCQSDKSLSGRKYQELARRLGWTWSPTASPRNVYEKTRWIDENGNEIFKSYKQLAYKNGS